MSKKPRVRFEDDMLAHVKLFVTPPRVKEKLNRYLGNDHDKKSPNQQDADFKITK